jgi:hypothetical protein
VAQDDELTAKYTLRFQQATESPHVFFRVLSDDGQLAYSMQTTIGSEHRTFAAGEEAEIEVTFTPRLGGGGTYRTALVVSDKSGAATLATDDDGTLFYVTPRLGVIGPADLDAQIKVDGTVLSDHAPLLLDEEAPEG